MAKSIGLVSLQMGVCYYPEHWPESLWQSDLDRMLAAGIDVIRIAEFAWSKFEPTEGTFTFDFFDRYMELVAKTPMKVIFCTPTATPPAWLTEKYPDVLLVDMDGQVHRHGMRRHYNYNSEVYIEKTRIIVEKIAEHYAGHTSIIGFQIDNELNCGTDEFYANADHDAFRRFVKEKYQTLDCLNEAWGCVFWNQEYTAWEEVHLPRHTGRKSPNPHMVLDSKRFFSNSAIRYCKLQHDILRKYLPHNQFITTNGIFNHVDYDEMVDTALDFLTYDSYPALGYNALRCPPDMHPLLDRKWSSNLAKTRCVSPQFGVMEQQSGSCGGTATGNNSPTPKPGQLRLWSFQSIAHGADFINYFRWRTCTFGTEIYWHGILGYDNLDNRRLAEVVRTREDMRKIEDVAGSVYEAKVAIMRDYDNEWDGEHDTWHGKLRDTSNANWFTALQLSHTTFDYVSMSERINAADLAQYGLVIYPHPTIVTEHTAQVLKEYVAVGGNLLIGARAGYKDERGQCPMREMPGLLSELLGATVEDFTLLSYLEQDKTVNWGDEKLDAILFNDILSPRSENCEVLGTFCNDYYMGKPAFTCNRYGKGKAYYYGAGFSIEAARIFLRKLGYSESFGDAIQIPECCEVTVRRKNGKRFLFVLNYSCGDVSVELKKPLRNLLDGKICSGLVPLEAYGVLVMELV